MVRWIVGLMSRPRRAFVGLLSVTEASKALMRTLVLNSTELRGALAGVYEGAAFLTKAQWSALLGLRRQLESGAARQRREWLRTELSRSGSPLWAQWCIGQRLKGKDFAPRDLEAEIQAIWGMLIEAARAEMDAELSR